MLLRSLGACIFLALAAGYGPAAFAQGSGEDSHVTIENPADLTADDANAVYDKLKELLAESYARARLPILKNYQAWKRYNSAPYLSATHGQRFVNNYAQGDAGIYGTLEADPVFPAGTVLAKDTITVTDGGRIFPGAMFVMEKLAAGASPKTADWRYVMVIPDGTVFGDTLGDEPEAVKYCHACHKARAKQDYVFFVPEKYRVKP